MTARSLVPFNVDLLELTPKRLEGIKPVTSMDIFEGATSNLAEDGLFSPSIFGKVGDDRRMVRVSYIDIKVSVFHPVLYRALVGLKRLYAGILSGKEYAIWNELEKDFERSDELHGQTGFEFFVSKWKDIEFGETKSSTRQLTVQLVHKFRDRAMTSKIVVMPAGLRDVEIGADGRVQKDEINNFYSTLLAVSNTISPAALRHDPRMVNTSRYRLQATFCELYDTIESMIEGKKKLLMGKTLSRRLQNGTRNVVTAMDTSVSYLGAPGSVGFNNTVIGLYQMLKAVSPVSIFNIRNGFLQKVFPAKNAPAVVVDRKTYRAKQVLLEPLYYDGWMTDEGINDLITSFGQESMRHMPITIKGDYLGLVYTGPDGTFKIIQDLEEIPANRNKTDVHPLTFCELLYLSTYHVLNRHPLFVTRYPITGPGSIYPSKAFVKTTVKSEVRRELSDQWEPLDETRIAYEFPLLNGPFVNSMSPHSARLDGLTMDFDGDTASGNATYSDESIAEVDHYLTLKRAYVGTDGRFLSSTAVSTVNLVMHNLTGG